MKFSIVFSTLIATSLAAPTYISYGALRADTDPRTNVHPKPANPYTRPCTLENHCARITDKREAAPEPVAEPKYISYDALKADADPRTNVHPKPANPYTRPCTLANHCARITDKREASPEPVAEPKTISYTALGADKSKGGKDKPANPYTRPCTTENGCKRITDKREAAPEPEAEPKYISYGALGADNSNKGGKPQPANPYTRPCTLDNHCARITDKREAVAEAEIEA